MKDFINHIEGVVEGTDLNRDSMMAIQGFIENTIVFNNDGTIVETNADGHTLTTVFNDDGSITQTFVGDETITLTTTFVGNTIKEEVS